MSYMRTFYAMKNKLGHRLSPREKMLMNPMHMCPGNISHNVPRQDIIFNNYVGKGHKAYVMYWRSHLNEYKQMTNAEVYK